MKTDVVLLPGLHGSRALFASFVALAPSWARCRPLALPSIGGQSFDEIAEVLLPELRALESFVLLGESFSGPIAARLAPPLLGILGINDRLVSPSRSHAFLSRIPQSTVVEIDGPHLIVQARPADVWAAISEEFESAA